MVQILRQYIEGDILVTEYTRDFTINEGTGEVIISKNASVSHTVKTPIQNETAGEQLPPLPPNPLLQLQQENAELKARIEVMQKVLDELILGGM